jgi:hypothetical protein
MTTPSESSGAKEFSVAQTGSLLNDDFLPDGPYTSANSFGQWRGGPGGAAIRGGSWQDLQSPAGAFTLNLFWGPSILFTGIGFRCSYRPW